VETWGAKVQGSLWRTTGDIVDNWESMSQIIDRQYPTWTYAGPGRFNDPDMLVVGTLGWSKNLHKTRLTPSEQYYHISMWSMLAAPLLLGCDLTKLDAFTKNLLTNQEVLAINQDEAGRQGHRIYADSSKYPYAQRSYIEVWAKPLANGDVAIGVFNRGSQPSTYMLDLKALNLSQYSKRRDVWRQKELASNAIAIPRHGCALIRLSK
jgi:alpha-galactosidase